MPRRAIKALKDTVLVAQVHLLLLLLDNELLTESHLEHNRIRRRDRERDEGVDYCYVLLALGTLYKGIIPRFPRSLRNISTKSSKEELGEGQFNGRHELHLQWHK